MLNTGKAVVGQLWCLVNSPLYGITATFASDLGLAANTNRERKKREDSGCFNLKVEACSDKSARLCHFIFSLACLNIAVFMRMIVLLMVTALIWKLLVVCGVKPVCC